MTKLKIKFSPVFLWQVSVIAFLTLFVAVLLLNLNIFSNSKNKIENASNDYERATTMIKEDILDEIFSNVEKRKSVFEGIFLNKPNIKDPFSL